MLPSGKSLKAFGHSSTASASESRSGTETPPNENENEQLGTNNSPITRRRLTIHRESLLRIHNDMSEGRSTRHAVPDPSSVSKWDPDDDEADVANRSELGGAPERWVEKHQQNLRETCSQHTCHDWTATLLPMYRWLHIYRWKEYLGTDVMAGLTVGVMIVPQSMSYAKLAGLPVEFGLYSSLVPIYAYALFGSSRQLAVGPVALVSLLLNTGLTMILERDGKFPETTPDYDAIYATLALQTSVLVGICYIVMGLLRLGFVTIFLSHAVISGFTSAAAIIIGLTQIKYIFGYDIPNDKSLHKILENIFASINEFNWKTFLLGTSCIFTLIGLKKLAHSYPRLKWTRAAGPLVVTVISIALQAGFDLEDRGIPIVGHIPSGFPKFSGSVIFPVADFGNLSIVVLSIVIVGFMESIAIAKQLASKHNYQVDASLELIGLGMANLTSGLFGGYPVTGSFSRSAVNNESGAQSGLSGIVTASVVALALLFLTPVFELLPLAVLASIVISGVVSLVDYTEAVYLWRVHKFDFGVWVFAFLGTLFLGVELGLGIAVGISLLLVLFESAYPPTTVLGRLPGTHQYRSVKQYPGVECYDGIVMVRVDAPIYFANTQYVREKVQKYYQRAEERLATHRKQQHQLQAAHLLREQSLQDKVRGVQFIILELSPVAHIDTSALHTLQEMAASFRKNQDIQLCLANPNPRVMHRLLSSGLADEIGREYIFVSLHDAVDHCLHHMDTQELEQLRSSSRVLDQLLSPRHDPAEIDELMKYVEPSSAAMLHTSKTSDPATNTRAIYTMPTVTSENAVKEFSDHRAENDLEVGSKNVSADHNNF